MTKLENRFNEDMKNIYVTAKKEYGYNATRFLQLLSEKGGIQAAKILISKGNGTSGFTELMEKGALGLSVEAHVLKAEYNELFSDAERIICRDRLKGVGYEFNKDNEATE
jgi:hypothetical protein